MCGRNNVSQQHCTALQCTAKALKCTAMHHTVEHSAHRKIHSAQCTVYSAQCPRAGRESNARHVSTQLLSHSYTAGELGEQRELTVHSCITIHNYCHSVTQLLSPQLLSHSYCLHSYCHKATVYTATVIHPHSRELGDQRGLTVGKFAILHNTAVTPMSDTAVHNITDTLKILPVKP